MNNLDLILKKWLWTLWADYETAQCPRVNSSMISSNKNELHTDYTQTITLIPVNNNVLLLRLLDFLDDITR